jgi:3-hydroxyisobutyrate dehydrogenase-like beta-hydroxyacid dehydrogenase
MKPVVAVIAQGAMGAAVAKRLVDNGLEVRTSLAGRGPDSEKRARAAGMTPVNDDQIVNADIFLSIVPPGDAVAFAERFAPLMRASNHKPVFVDCNAVSPPTAERIAAVIEPTGSPFVDAGIVGAPPRDGYDGPVFYASGAEATRFAVLGDYGLKIRVLGGPLTAASALKMSYAGITKGLTALGSVMMLAATRGGTADALYDELKQSQPQLLAWLTRQVPAMYSKAYRFVGEMEEIADFVGEDVAAREMFEGITHLYERLAQDVEADGKETGALSAFLRQPPS